MYSRTDFGPYTLVTREDKDMVRAITRIMGSKTEERTLSDCNYGSPAPNHKAHSRGAGKPQRELPSGKKARNKRKSPPKFFNLHKWALSNPLNHHESKFKRIRK
jgi:hypothetical protein